MSNLYSRRDVLKGVGLGIAGTTVTRPVLSNSVTANSHTRYMVGVYPGDADVARSEAETVVRELDFGSRGKTIVGRFSEQAKNRLENEAGVRYIETDVQYRASGQSEATTSQQIPSGVKQINADRAHEAGITGDGIHVAVLDSGIDSTHETLAENLGSGTSFVDCTENCYGGSSQNRCSEGWDDDNGHGTHVAGTIGAANNETGVVGVAPDVTLHSVKVLDCVRNGSLSTLADAITYVTDRGWDIANLSLGGTSGSETLRDACKYATENGVILVAAAGSTGPCTDCVLYPAAYESVIAVTGVDENNELVPFARTGPEIEFAAPGAEVFSSVPDTDGYEAIDGSSQACPHVSGAIALLLADGYSGTEARQRLRDSSVDVGLSPEQQGYGRIDVASALNLDHRERDDKSDPSLTIDRLDVAVQECLFLSRYRITWNVSSQSERLETISLRFHTDSYATGDIELDVSDINGASTEEFWYWSGIDKVSLTATATDGAEITELKRV